MAETGTRSADWVAQQLCLQCGLCCDGTLFKDVELQVGDAPAPLRALGLRVDTRRRAPRFPQPCAAFDGCRCRIHGERPARCRDFECLLFKAVMAGRVEIKTALRAIAAARQNAQRVRQLLRELGDANEHTALSVRFRQVRKRFGTAPRDAEAVALFGELTLAMHDLNLTLSTHFFR